MKARLVTGYIPILNHPRSATEYGDLGEKLSGVPCRKKAFYMEVKDTWLAKYLRMLAVKPTWSVGDNQQKNSLAYHCVQHQKFEWLAQAAKEYEDDEVMVWVDYGIFHQPGINNEVIWRFMQSVDDKAIYIPGCWPQNEVVNQTHPCWRWVGSMIAVPAKLTGKLHRAVKRACEGHIALTNNVEWEVNTIARVENQGNLPFKWYAADHNQTQFTNYPNYRIEDENPSV